MKGAKSCCFLGALGDALEREKGSDPVNLRQLKRLLSQIKRGQHQRQEAGAGEEAINRSPKLALIISNSRR